MSVILFYGRLKVALLFMRVVDWIVYHHCFFTQDYHLSCFLGPKPIPIFVDSLEGLTGLSVLLYS